MSFKDAKLIVFDLDMTLAESKLPIAPSMAETVRTLLTIKKVGVISGAHFNQFEKQVLASFADTEQFENLFLMPATGTRLHTHRENTWSLVYENLLTSEEKQKIADAFSQALVNIDYKMPETIYGELLEDRDSQITFSGLGQEAPLDKKSTWDPDHTKRAEIAAELQRLIPEFSIHIGGTTSIDVTARGVNKATGVRGIQNHLGLETSEIIFVGDALFPGGNDYPVIETGVECISVENPTHTERLIKSWLESIGREYRFAKEKPDE